MKVFDLKIEIVASRRFRQTKQDTNFIDRKLLTELTVLT